MSISRWAWAGAWAVLGFVATAEAQQFPTTPPPATPIAPARFPPFQESVLPNGLRMIVVESHRQPVLSVSLSIPAGSAYDPAGKHGLADFVAGLLTKGAGSRSADEISQAIEGVGGSLGATATPDFITVQADVLSSSAPLAFELLSDVVLRPRFDSTEVELLRRQTLSGLQAELADPGAVASRIMLRFLYGEHPYAFRATPGTVNAITREDLTGFREARFRPSGALLVIAGDVTAAEARRLATKSFGSWPGAAPAPLEPPAPPKPTATEVVLVHRPGSVQANILVGNATYPATDTTYYAATVANRVLGDGSDSRLFMILREQKGWTYGAYSQLSRPRGVGMFQASAEVRTEVADSALRELLAQLKRITTELVPPSELAAAKNSLVGSFPLSVQTANQIAAAVARARLLGLPANYVQTYRNRLNAVTASRLRAAARATIKPDVAMVVVVGDGARLYPALKAIGPVRILSTEGRELTAEDLEPKATPLNLALDRLVPRRDSLSVMVQGRKMGYQTAALERVGGKLKYTEITRIQGFVDQTTELMLDSAGGMISTRQSGQMQGQKTSIDVTYGGGRVRGSAQVMSPEGPKSFAVDTTVPETVLDDNALQALLPAFRWAPGASWNLEVFSSGENRIKRMTLAVTATQTVSVPGGTFEAYRAELTSGDQAVAFYLTTSAPHRLIRVAVANTPIEFVAEGP